jgi:hypothetical protein
MSVEPEPVDTGDETKFSPWAIPTFMLWFFFMVIAVAPDVFFEYFRTVGRVLTQDAWINNVYVMTIGFSGYYAWFVSERCTEGGLSSNESKGRATQVFVLGLLAFMPFTVTIQLLLSPQAILVSELRYLAILVAIGKMLAWFYLVGLLFAYYVLDYRDVFVQIPSMFPSSYAKPKHVAIPEEELRAMLRTPETTKDTSGT